MTKKTKNIKIVDETATTNSDFVVAICAVKYLNDYVLEVHFGDGYIQKVDFAPFLISSRHPEVRKYLETDLFRGFVLDNGNLYWGDYDLIFPVMDLYANKI